MLEAYSLFLYLRIYRVRLRCMPFHEAYVLNANVFIMINHGVFDHVCMCRDAYVFPEDV